MSTQPSADRPEPPGAQKVGLAVVLGLIMIVVSSTTALYTGYLLWKGDPGTEVLNTLPAGCAWVALAQDTDALDVALAEVPRWHALPRQVTASVREIAAEVRSTLGAAAPAIAPDAGVGLCRWHDGWVLTLGLRPGNDQAVTLLQRVVARHVGVAPERWRTGDPVGGFIEYALPSAGGPAAAAMLQGAKRLVIALPAPPFEPAGAAPQGSVAERAPADASALLTRVVKATRAKPMREDVTVRSAMERVGGGALQLGAAPAALKRWSAPLHGAFPAALLHPFGTFAGLSVRREAERTHVHVHLGEAPQGIALLKRTLDPVGMLKGSRHLDPDVDAAGVIRFAPAGLADHGARLAQVPLVGRVLGALAASDATDSAADPSDPAVPSATARRLSALVTGHGVWQRKGSTWRVALQLRPGQDAQATAWLARQSERPRSARLALAVTPGWLVVAPADAADAAARFAAARGYQTDALPDELATERTRMLDSNQGFFVGAGHAVPGLLVGPAQFESLWLDTGFVAHLSFPTPHN